MKTKSISFHISEPKLTRAIKKQAKVEGEEFNPGFIVRKILYKHFKLKGGVVDGRRKK